MNNMSHDVVRIGVGPACFKRITPLQVEFIDEAGQKRSIDLWQCARNLNLSLELGDDENECKYVGYRGALDDPPWVQLMNDQETRFEFATADEMYEQLLILLMRVGWDTIDMN